LNAKTIPGDGRDAILDFEEVQGGLPLRSPVQEEMWEGEKGAMDEKDGIEMGVMSPSQSPVSARESWTSEKSGGGYLMHPYGAFKR
jgi:hypothetical protein